MRTARYVTPSRALVAHIIQSQVSSFHAAIKILIAPAPENRSSFRPCAAQSIQIRTWGLRRVFIAHLLPLNFYFAPVRSTLQHLPVAPDKAMYHYSYMFEPREAQLNLRTKQKLLTSWEARP